MDRIAKLEADSEAHAKAIERLTIHMDQGFASLRAEMRAGDAELRDELRASNAEQNKRVDALRTELNEKIDRVHVELDRKIDVHLRWTVGLYASNMLAILGLYFR
ncbi:MAG: hypothetical protein V4463_23815 [Pseudomonadota bacterium]